MEITSTRGYASSNPKPQQSLTQLISLYKDAPQEELTLDDFERIALDRLQLLRGIEKCNTSGFVGAEFDSKIEKVSNRSIQLLIKLI